MKFQELNEEQKTAAIRHFTNELIEAISAGAIRFNDKLNKDRLQSRIDKAAAKAEEMATPWFFGEILLEDKYCKDRLESMAVCDAEDTEYKIDSRGVLCVVNCRLLPVHGVKS